MHSLFCWSPKAESLSDTYSDLSTISVPTGRMVSDGSWRKRCADPLGRHKKIVRKSIRKVTQSEIAKHPNLTEESFICRNCNVALSAESEKACNHPMPEQSAPDLPCGAQKSDLTCLTVPRSGAKLSSRISSLKKAVNRLRVRLCRKTKQFEEAQSRLGDISPEAIIESLKTKLNGTQFAFFKSQLKLSKFDKRGRRYDGHEKKLALSLYIRSPQAYRLMTKFFLLPSERSLVRWRKSVRTDPGFCDETLSLLEQRSYQMTRRQKIIVLSFDEVQLKKGLDYDQVRDKIEGYVDYGDDVADKSRASHALTFMIHGLFDKWKLPLAYFFSGPWNKERHGTKGETTLHILQFVMYGI